MAVQNSPLGDLSAIRNIAMQRQAMGVPSPQGGGMPPAMPEQPPMMPEQPPVMPQQPPMPQQVLPEQNLNKVFKTPLPDGDTLETKILGDLLERAKINTASDMPSQGLSMAAAPELMNAMQNKVKAAQGGGLMRLAVDDGFSGQVQGKGHGMQDNVYMPIVERQAGSQIGTLAVSPDEYVVDAHTMSALGNGNADEGARYMDNMVKNIREQAYGTSQQPNQINGLAALRPMMERV